jgi:hypothetical protein
MPFEHVTSLFSYLESPESQRLFVIFYRLRGREGVKKDTISYDLNPIFG